MHYPRHIGIIPDGNRTRAKEHDFPTVAGHKQWSDNVSVLARYIFEHTEIDVMTIRWLSTENMAERSSDELSFLFELCQMAVERMIPLMEEHHISFRRAGSHVGMPDDLRDYLVQTQEKYRYETDKTIVLAFNYGGRDEILRAIQKVASQTDIQTLQTIDAETLSDAMDFGWLPVVDLVVRTKGWYASRISWFMLWWIGYAELYFTDKYFPEFDVAALQEALVWYDQRWEQRNFGK